jgi:hypothetical protein
MGAVCARVLKRLGERVEGVLCHFFSVVMLSFWLAARAPLRRS